MGLKSSRPSADFFLPDEGFMVNPLDMVLWPSLEYVTELESPRSDGATEVEGLLGIKVTLMDVGVGGPVRVLSG